MRDSSSKETRKPREWGKDFEEVEVSYQWDSRSKKEGKPSERDSLAQKLEKSVYWVPHSQKVEESCKWDSRPPKAEKPREWDNARKLQIYPMNGTHLKPKTR